MSGRISGSTGLLLKEGAISAPGSQGNWLSIPRTGFFQDLLCYFCFEPLLFDRLQAHFLIHLLKLLLHVFQSLEFR